MERGRWSAFWGQLGGAGGTRLAPATDFCSSLYALGPGMVTPGHDLKVLLGVEASRLRTRQTQPEFRACAMRPVRGRK